MVTKVLTVFHIQKHDNRAFYPFLSMRNFKLHLKIYFTTVPTHDIYQNPFLNVALYKGSTDCERSMLRFDTKLTSPRHWQQFRIISCTGLIHFLITYHTTIRPHQMQEMQTIVMDDINVCQSVTRLHCVHTSEQIFSTNLMWPSPN